MRKLTSAIFAVLLFACACDKELPQPVSQEKITRIRVSVPETTKTELDGMSVLWTDDDRIVVNGLKSNGTSVSEDRRTAEFTFPEATAPLYLLSPASAYVLASFSPAESKYGSMIFPETQTFVPGSFDPAASMMATVSSDGNGNITFHHMAAYIKFTISSTTHSHAVRRIEISAPGGEDLSGEYAFNPTTMKLERPSRTGGKVVLSASADGIELGTPVWVAVPAVNYSEGINVRIVDVKNHYQDVKSTAVLNAEPGKVYSTAIDFAPTGTIITADTDGNSQKQPTKSILFIGNSHTLDSTDLLPAMLNSEGVRNISMTRVYHGGYYLVGYNAYYTKADNCSIMTWEPGQNYFRGDEHLTHTLKEAVEYGGYDIVVMQEYAGNSHCWTWDDAERSAIAGLISKIKASSPNAEIVYFLSHCFATDYSVLADNFSNSHVNQFNTCAANNGAHVLDPAEGFGITRIISTGALIENLRTTGLNDVAFDMLRGDKIHQDYGLTRFAASSLIWKTIFTPLTGKESEDISFRVPEYYPSSTIRCTPVNADNIAVVHAAVKAAYEHPLEITDLGSYSASPSYTHVPGSVMVDQKGVIVEPVTFPVSFPIGISGGKYACAAETQPIWNGYGIWEATQQQATAKWVSLGNPVEGLVYRRTFANNASGNLSSVAVDCVWTGDYMEFIIPVKNFAAGTKVRFAAPVYNRYAPVSWAMDYLDGAEWKTASTPISLSYTFTDVSVDMTFEKAVESGFLRFRLRCVDGTVQTSPDGTVTGSTPHMSGSGYDSVFYFWNSTAKAVTFSKI